MKTIESFFNITIRVLEILKNIFEDIFWYLDRNRKDKENDIVTRFYCTILCAVIGLSWLMGYLLAMLAVVALVVILGQFFIGGEGGLRSFILD